MRVALIHYWLVNMRGGEKVLEALCRMFPAADIFTHVFNPDGISKTILRHRITTTAIASLPFARTLYQSYLPFMPLALEQLDLSGYDLVISCESGPAKGVIPAPDAIHLCYCHSPMRYLWDQYTFYRNRAGRLTRLMMPPLTGWLRQWDVTSAARVDGFVANSRHVAGRIRKYWRRDAVIVHPPVDVNAFAPVARSEIGNYYLWAGELVDYKRPDLVIDAFNQLGLPLLVIGGPDRAISKLRKQARDNIHFLGKVSFDILKDRMARCRALVFPGEEDFGIVPVEAMASGRPVVAYGRGGVLDTVIDGQTGILFKEQTTDALIEAIGRLDKLGLAEADGHAIAAHVQRFDEAHFRSGMTTALSSLGFIAQSDTVTVPRVDRGAND